VLQRFPNQEFLLGDSFYNTVCFSVAAATQVRIFSRDSRFKTASDPEARKVEMKHWFSHVRSWTDKLIVAILGMALASSLAFASGKDGGNKNPPAPCPGICMTIGSATVPPDGLFQLQLLVTEPKPVGAGSSAFTFSRAVFGAGVGASVNSPSGRSCGVALQTTSGFSVALLSPDAQLGTGGDSAIVTITLPVRPDAQLGTQVPLNLNQSGAVFLDASGQPYSSLQVEAGTLTIGGTINVTSVTPAGVQVPAGSTIAIWGTGFTSSATVDVEGVNVVTSKVVSSREIDVTLDQTILLDGVRVRVRADRERVMYYPYLRTAEIGSSSNPMITVADPLFSRITYTAASLPWTRANTVFTGMALQNPGTSPAQVTLELLSAGNRVLQTFSLPLPGRSKMTEDLLDLFAQPPAEAVAVRIRSSQSIQMLGMHGDTVAGTIVPVVVSAP
jgi:hypothetical protein